MQVRDVIVDLLIEAGIPCAPVRSIEEVIEDPELTERRMLIDSEYPTRGKIRITGTPIKMSDAPDELVTRRRPAALGEHNGEILASIGIDARQLKDLEREGVV
jgi:crotonobetainyl-CoA:carnitine CoA-transferase CaiB-like acyl-CoA transferase